MKQDLYVISEEDQTSYRETNRSDINRGSVANLRSIYEDITIDSRKGSLMEPDYIIGSGKNSEKRISQSIN